MKLLTIRQVPLFLSVLFVGVVLGQVSYSVPEEMPKGSFVGNIAQDLGLDVKRLQSGKARVFTRDSTTYVELNRERGILLMKERIDREALCGPTTPCALKVARRREVSRLIFALVMMVG
uniref:Cadherin N-terminal domain-containing protein n=1 Tax=Scophthalmus maximus TaxID=52904 RepID=A0A8D3E271_SCOMX